MPLDKNSSFCWNKKVILKNPWNKIKVLLVKNIEYVWMDNKIDLRKFGIINEKNVLKEENMWNSQKT